MTLKTRPTRRRETRAEALMFCPACGNKGEIRYGHGETGGLHTFICRAYRYFPHTDNECRFAFAVSDEQLRRFR